MWREIGIFNRLFTSSSSLYIFQTGHIPLLMRAMFDALPSNTSPMQLHHPWKKFEFVKNSGDVRIQFTSSEELQCVSEVKVR